MAVTNPVKLTETYIAFGKKKQADIATATAPGTGVPTAATANLWRMDKLNANLMSVRLNSEDNYGSIGKGYEYADALYPSHWDVSGSLEKFASVESLIWAAAFALGNITVTGASAPFTYTITPIVSTTGLELPYFSFGEVIRPGASAAVDRMSVGNAVEEFALSLQQGPGRGTAKLNVSFVGSGKLTEPSTLDFTIAPLNTMLAETALRAGNAAITINSVDYVANRNLVSLDLGWKNNINADNGFYIGSGFQTASPDSGAIRGRLEVGNRVPSLKFVARFDKNSTEYASMKALTTGTATVTLTKDTNNNVAFTFASVGFKVAEIGDTDGIVTVSVETSPLYSAGILSITGKCSIDQIGK